MINKQFLFLLAVLFSITFNVSAQENKISEEIKWIDGQKFYIHTVTKGQGFYTIKKIYNVSEKDILENNPEAFDGLKLGQKLKIPAQKKIKAETSDYKIHVIKSGESIYSISKIYNTTPEAIFKLNPEVQNGYKINQKIKIPKEHKQITDNQAIKKSQANTKNYKVKKKDTLYSLAKKFGITQESLLEANPSIKTEGLKKGQRIFIPKKDIIVKEALYIPIDTLHNTSITDDTLACDSSIIKRYTAMNVGIFLPFEIDKQAFEQEDDNKTPRTPQFSRKPFLEFYQGVLLAIKELKSEGYKLNIYTFNTKKDSNETKQILRKRIIQDLDLIIGPVYQQNFRIVRRATDSMHIPMVNPIIQGTQLVNQSSYTIDIFPSKQIITQKVIQLLIQNDTSRIHFVHSGFTDDLMLVSAFKKQYLKAVVAAGKDSSNYFHELIFSDSKKMNIKPFLDKEKHNLIVVLSDNQAFVSNVFTKLNILTEDYKIQLISRPKWKKFDNIDISYFHNLNVLQLTRNYVNYNDTNVIQFVKEYREFYNLEPNKYAFYAYDIASNLIPYFYKWNRLSCLKDSYFSGLSIPFYFKKTTNGGWINQFVFTLQYNNDFSIKAIENLEKQLHP